MALISRYPVLVLAVLWVLVISAYLLNEEWQERQACFTAEMFLSGTNPEPPLPPCDPFVELQLAYFGASPDDAIRRYRSPVLEHFRRDEPLDGRLMRATFEILRSYRVGNLSRSITTAHHVFTMVDDLEAHVASRRRQVFYGHIAFAYERALLEKLEDPRALWRSWRRQQQMASEQQFAIGLSQSVAQLECLFVLFHPAVSLESVTSSIHYESCFQGT